jgi:hypothetical protein
MAQKQAFTKQMAGEYHVYNDNLANHNALTRAGIEVKDGKVRMTPAQARYWLGMGIIGTMPKDEWDKHMTLADQGQGEQAGQLDSRNDTHNATQTGLSETHDTER